MKKEEIRDYDFERIKQNFKDTEMAYKYSNAPQLPFNYILDMKILIDIVDKEKEKNKGLDSEIIRTRATLNEVTKDYVSKGKIRDKLEYATKMMEFYITNEPDHVLIPIYNEVIKVCKELLEEN